MNKQTKKSVKSGARKEKPVAKVVETKAMVVVAKNVEDRGGLRGLKGLVFDRFAQAYAKSKDFGSLPTMDELTKEVGDRFPQSRWLARPKVHYSYYKSKFISSHKAA